MSKYKNNVLSELDDLINIDYEYYQELLDKGVNKNISFFRATFRSTLKDEKYKDIDKFAIINMIRDLISDEYFLIKFQEHNHSFINEKTVELSEFKASTVNELKAFGLEYKFKDNVLDNFSDSQLKEELQKRNIIDKGNELSLESNTIDSNDDLSLDDDLDFELEDFDLALDDEDLDLELDLDEELDEELTLDDEIDLDDDEELTLDEDLDEDLDDELDLDFSDEEDLLLDDDLDDLIAIKELNLESFDFPEIIELLNNQKTRERFVLPAYIKMNNGEKIENGILHLTSLSEKEQLLFYFSSFPIVSYHKVSELSYFTDVKISNIRSELNSLIDDGLIKEHQQMNGVNGSYAYSVTSLGWDYICKLTTHKSFREWAKLTKEKENTFAETEKLSSLLKVNGSKVNFEDYRTEYLNHFRDEKLFRELSLDPTEPDLLINLYRKRYSIPYQSTLDWINALRILRNKNPNARHNCYISALQTAYKRDFRTLSKYYYYFDKYKEDTFTIDHRKVADLLFGGAIEPSKYVIEHMVKYEILERHNNDGKITYSLKNLK
ncbi:hypothetical protein AAFX13_00485 [Vibrio parahaemolyticus]|uniref:hypothetical protein n=1 Tax=Vibrio parahaemolyticus TaxID=670 RepID=UPI0039803927